MKKRRKVVCFIKAKVWINLFISFAHFACAQGIHLRLFSKSTENRLRTL